MKKPVKPKAISPAVTRGDQNRVAKQLGISRQLLSLHMKNPQAPKLDDIEGWVQFLAVHGREGSGPPDLRRAIAQKRLELISEQVDREKRNNEEARRTLVQLDVVTRAQRFAVQTFCAQIQRLVRDAPSLLVGLTEIEIRQKLEEFEASILPTVKEAFGVAAGTNSGSNPE